MIAACPVPNPDAPLVRSLLDLTDCHVREFTRLGYGALFPAGGVLAPVLTALLTVFIALTGVRLMLGQGGLKVGDLTLLVLKLTGAIVFATQWETYQSLVFATLFDGPAALAGDMTRGLANPAVDGDLFERLQRAVDAMTGSAGPLGQAPATVHPPPAAGPGGFVLAGAAGVLLLSSLGVILASKIVLGALLATGPIFIALLIFDVTRGLFEGWLRATLAFAFAPLAITFLLAMMLSILEPWLGELATTPNLAAAAQGPVYGVVTVVLVFALVSAAVAAASAALFAGFRLPRGSAAPSATRQTPARSVGATAEPSRAARLAALAGAQARRDALRENTPPAFPGPEGRQAEVIRLAGIGATAAAARGQVSEQSRLVQTGRRTTGPRADGRRDRRRAP